MIIQPSCGPTPSLNKIFKKAQLHLLSSDIFYVFAGLDADFWQCNKIQLSLVLVV